MFCYIDGLYLVSFVLSLKDRESPSISICPVKKKKYGTYYGMAMYVCTYVRQLTIHLSGP